MSIGREFQRLGAHEENALSPYEENVFMLKEEVYLTISMSVLTHTA